MSDDASLREKQRRLRDLEKKRSRYGIATPSEITTEIEDLEAEIARLDGSAARAGLLRPPQPDFAHPYPIQSGFTGRVAERTMLTEWLQTSSQPVLAVIGIDGMGKSALTWAWLQRDVLGLPLPGATEDAPADAATCRLPEAARPEGVLWWSFYETQAGFASFLDEAIGYASDGRTNPRDIPSTYDKARTLLGLHQQRRLLLVLDGFERELRAYASMGAAYQGDIELLWDLFPDGEEHPPQLKDESDQAWILVALANSYSLSGQPRRALPLYKGSNVLREAAGDKENLAIGLGAVASAAYIPIGELAAAELNLRRRIELGRTSKDEFHETVGRQVLGRLLAYQGMFEEAEEKLTTSTRYWEQTNNKQRICLDEAYRAIRSLLMGGDPQSAFDSAHKARALADVQHVERDIIRAEWLLGAALVAQAAGEDDRRVSLCEADAHLTDALARCRKINMVDHEPDILLAWARWHQLQGNPAQARADADEALQIADRCEYRLAQADIHNFLARLALDAGDCAAARREAEIAKERALCDGPPHCYKPALDEAERLLAEIG